MEQNEERRPQTIDDGWVPSPHKSKKNTKKWCKGVVGREHMPEMRMTTYGWSIGSKCGWIGYRRVHWFCGHEMVCTICGKITKHFLPKDECPDYRGDADAA